MHGLELCREAKGADERIDGSVLHWFGLFERMENDRIAKRVHVEECVGSHLVGRQQKRWIDSVNDCLKKRGLTFGQARGIVYDRNEWRGLPCAYPI